MIKILWGRAGSGKTTFIAKEIANRASNGEGGLLWLVPEPFSHECERLLAKYGGPSCCLFAEVVTFGRLCDRLFVSPEALSGGGRLLCMRLAVDMVINELDLFAKKIYNADFLGELSALIDECICYNIEPEILLKGSRDAERISSKKLYELSLIFTSYKNVISNIAPDPRNKLTLLAEKLEKGNYALGKTLFVDSFVSFTPQESRVIAAFGNKAEFVKIALTGGDGELFSETILTSTRIENLTEKASFEAVPPGARFVNPYLSKLETWLAGEDVETAQTAGAVKTAQTAETAGAVGEIEALETKGISAVCAMTLREECAFIASEVKRLNSLGVRYRDMLVAVYDMGRYGFQLETAMKRANIPVFMDCMDDVSEKPIFRYLKAVRDIALGWRCGDVRALLDTGLFRAKREYSDLLGNYMKRYRPDRRWDKPFMMNPRGYLMPFTDDDTKQLRIINRLRTLLYVPISRLKNAKTAKDWVLKLSRFFEDAKLSRELDRRGRVLRSNNELKAWAECIQLWEILQYTLKQCASILGNAPMGFAEFMDLLLLSLSGEKVGTIPPSLDRLTIGDAQRLRRVSAKVVFVPGCDDSHMPPPLPPPGIFGETEYEILKKYTEIVPPDNDRRVSRESLNIYMTLSLPSEALYLTLTREGDGNILPFPLLTDICEKFKIKIDELPIAPKPVPPRPEAYAPVSSESVEALYGKEIYLSSYKLKYAVSCKWKYFCRYGLLAMEDVREGFTSLDKGVFIHGVLEKAISRIIQKDIKSFTPESVISLARELAFEDVRELWNNTADYRLKRYLEILINAAGNVVLNVWQELKGSGFKPVGFELGFGKHGDYPPIILPQAGGFSFMLEGRVDRLDEFISPEGRRFIKVADYKTGKIDSNDLQLPLYLSSLAKLSDSVPAGFLTVPAQTPVVLTKTRLDTVAEKKELDKLLVRKGVILNDPSLPYGEDIFLPGPKNRISPDELDDIFKETDTIIAGVTASIAAGEVTPMPCEEACEYCVYANSCGKENL